MPQVSSAEIAKHKAAQAKRPKRASIEEAENGGYIVEHHTDEYPNPKHAFKNGNEAIKHLKHHFGMSEKAEEKAEKR